MKGNSNYKFLKNTPIGKDLFEGKSQDKIACIVSEVLEQQDFQIIGIDGGWGTGKSNLVKIIENKLDHDKYNFFIYDVWGHQEDDQRKAILVELTEYVADEKRKIVVDSEKWAKKLKRLLSKEKEVTTTNTPYLSIGFILSLFLIIYIPSVNTFAKDLDSIWLKCLLVLFPITIIFFIYFSKVLKNFRKFESNKFKKSLKLSLQQTIQIYSNKQTDETKYESISESEPSVKDFRDWMRGIDTDLGINKKKLIIVFDNFDRLPKKQIQSIWSSIHIFFSDEKYANINVIIPFDRLHIKNAFSDLNGTDKNQANFANDYINKTFDLVYRISPPIMSNWKLFFRNCWNEAFQQNVDEDEYIKVEQIYEVYSKVITPREIIAFINEVISVKLLHNNIPERYIGLFVINKSRILDNPLEAITKAEFLDGLSYQYRDDDKFQRYITALSYQIDPDNALEIVYRKQLKDSLMNNDSNNLIEISKTNIFNKIVSPVLSEVENLENPILALNSLTAEANITEHEKQNIWDDIFLRLRGQSSEHFILSEPQKVVLVQISSSLREQWISKIFVDLHRSTKFDSVKYAQFVDELKIVDSQNELGVDIYNLLKPKTTTIEDFILLVKNKKDQYTKYQVSVNASDLDKYLSELEVEDLDDIAFIKHLTSTYNFKNFENSIKESIKANKSDKANLNLLFNALKLIADSTIGILLEDSEIYTLFTQSKSEEDFYYDLVAMRLARGNDFYSTYHSHFHSIINTEEITIINKISERIEYYISYSGFLLKSVSFSNNLTKAVARNIVKNSYQTSRAYINDLIKKYDIICNTNELDPQVFFKDLNRWKAPEFDKPFIKTIPILFYDQALKNKSGLAKASIDALHKYFDGLSQEEWELVFDDLEGRDYSLLKKIDYSDWNSFSLEALKGVLLLTSKTDEVEDKDKLTELVVKFEENGKDLTNTFKNIRDELIIHRSMNTDLFSFFGKWLFKYAYLQERPGDVLRTILVSSLLDEENCLGLIIQNHELIKSLIDNSNSSDSADFKEAIRDRFDDDKIKKLAKSIGVRKRKSKEDKLEVEE
ncbi:P-loop NTPase fold protein [Pontibacter saemangeumensis]|uniref:P-loop NTPase fold protein n=1 Tax=Pontibacter saemangeumensis TaxID=1084525 RepID=A0ABP8M3L9_9BACT